jgi:nucleoside-diphosphate-sugar epimerase/predicted dehydrogenase
MDRFVPPRSLPLTRTPRSTTSKNLLVTGASGFVGRSFCAAAVSQGHTVHAVVRREAPELEGVRQIVSDIRLFDAGAVPADTDAVIHLASGTQGSAEAIVDVAVKGTRRAFAATRDAGVPRFVHVSSLSVYPGEPRVDEEDGPARGVTELDPHPGLRGAYAASKIQAERALYEEASSRPQTDTNIAVVRPGLVFGPGLAGPLAGTAALAPLGLAILQGSASQTVPVIDIDDLCSGLLALVEAPAPWPSWRVYDVLDTRAPTKAEFIRLYGHCSGQDPHLVRVPRPLALLGAKAVDRIRKSAPATEYKVRRGYAFDPGSLDAEAFWNQIKTGPVVSPERSLKGALTVTDAGAGVGNMRSPREVAAAYLELAARGRLQGEHRWIILGAGQVSRDLHLGALRSLGDRVAAVIDTDATAARELADLLSPQMPVHRTLEDLPDEVTSGATAVIATPGYTHHALAMSALARGCHLLIEKPVVLSINELTSLRNAATDSGATVSAIHNYRLRRNAVQLWRFLADHDVGALVRAHVEFHTGSLMTESARWMRAEARHRTLVFELAIHFVDIVCVLGGTFVGEPWTSSHRNRVGGGVAAGLAGGRLQAGADFDLCVSTLGSARRTSVTLEFERASVELSFFPEGFRVLPPRRNPVDDMAASARELAGFARQTVTRLRRRSPVDSPHALIYQSHADDVLSRAPNPFSVGTAEATVSTLERIAAGWYGA